jgi:hypothetical protein
MKKTPIGIAAVIARALCTSTAILSMAIGVLSSQASAAELPTPICRCHPGYPCICRLTPPDRVTMNIIVPKSSSRTQRLAK